MPTILRLLLILASVASLLYIIRKIRRAQVRLADAIVWLGSSAVFIVISIFPGLVFYMCDLLHIQSPTNLVYLIVIFFLLMEQFIASLKISALESRLDALAQETALRDDRFLHLDTRDRKQIREDQTVFTEPEKMR